jgi:hypothetical protein
MEPAMVRMQRKVYIPIALNSFHLAREKTPMILKYNPYPIVPAFYGFQE